jgi:flagellar motility protein MotE (MotC chaperone)
VKNIRLLPVVVLAVAALLVLKTLGLVINGGYVLTGVGVAQAQDHGGAAATTETGSDGTTTLPGEPTLEDTSPTLADPSPTIGQPAEGGGHSTPAPAADHAPPAAGAETAPEVPSAVDEAEHAPEPVTAETSGVYCVESDAAIQQDGTVIINPASAAAAADHGGATEAEPADAAAAAGHGGEPLPEADSEPSPTFASTMSDCLPSGDAIPLQIDGKGGSLPLLTTDGGTLTEQQLLERLAARRTELEQYEQDLVLRASIVNAAEQRIEERTATLAALEAQISTLVDQRQEMESGQFAGIVAMYETMKPKDAANIFNNLDMDVLLRVAKTMSPRKMAPILAEMDAVRAQELTVKMADLADQPAAEMTPEDLAALPQIVGQ